MSSSTYALAPTTSSWLSRQNLSLPTLASLPTTKVRVYQKPGNPQFEVFGDTTGLFKLRMPSTKSEIVEAKSFVDVEHRARIHGTLPERFPNFHWQELIFRPKVHGQRGQYYVRQSNGKLRPISGADYVKFDSSGMSAHSPRP